MGPLASSIGLGSWVLDPHVAFSQTPEVQDVFANFDIPESVLEAVVS